MAPFYTRPSYEVYGAGYPGAVFSGSRRQKGGGILGSLKNLVVPALKSVGKKALGEAVGFAGNVAQDVMSGKNLKDSLKRRGVERGKRMLGHLKTEGLNAVQQVTGSRKRKAPSSSRQNSKRRRVTKRKTKRRRGVF